MFRGVVPAQGMKAYVQEKLDLVDLGEAGDKVAESYSGGMKRRLSVVLATIGNDLDILFLDEPTTVFLPPPPPAPYTSFSRDWILSPSARCGM